MKIRVKYICDNISLNSSYTEKCFGKKCRENQNTLYVQYFFSKNYGIFERMQKNMVEPDRPQITI